MNMGNIQHSTFNVEHPRGVRPVIVEETFGFAQRTERGCVADQPQQRCQSESLTNSHELRLVLRTQPRSEKSATHHVFNEACSMFPFQL
jgi:hypothetical protein